MNKGVLLKDLVDMTDGLCRIAAGEDVEILSVEYDSRKVRPGSLFVAVKGYESDGHGYVDSALENGASALVISEDRLDEFLARAGKEKNIPVIASSDSRKALSSLSSVFYNNPSSEMKLVGVTGTNGKTSITYMIESVLESSGVKTGVIGTVNYRWAGNEIPAPNTTPESRDLQEILNRMRNDGVETVIMEVSSHALELNRADHIEFDVGVFTNLTLDHLDFHKDFESYFLAKKRLFDLLERSPKDKKAGFVNSDDEYGRRILADKDSYSYRINGFGFSEISDYMPDEESVSSRIHGISYVMKTPFAGKKIELSLSGRFQVYNSLSAMAVLHHLGLGFDEISSGLSVLKNVPGRFDVVVSGLGFSIVVDYAHTADAVLKLLQSARELTEARLITVIGCGGDRDMIISSPNARAYK